MLDVIDYTEIICTGAPLFEPLRKGARPPPAENEGTDHCKNLQQQARPGHSRRKRFKKTREPMRRINHCICSCGKAFIRAWGIGRCLKVIRRFFSHRLGGLGMCRHNENLCGPPEPEAGLGKFRNELELSACALVPRHAVYAVVGCLAGRC